MQFEDAFPQPEPLYPIKSWSDVPPDIAGAEIHGLAVKDFAPLRTLSKLRALRALCDTPKQYDTVGSLTQLRWLALDHCGATGLARFDGLTNLRALNLFAFKAASLDGVQALPALEYLQIEHAPKIASLDPLGGAPGCAGSGSRRRQAGMPRARPSRLTASSRYRESRRWNSSR